MKTNERSAGFVVFHVDSATQARSYLLLNYGRYWDFAKGHVEAGEDDLTAATRELLEETGLTQVEVLRGFRKEIIYFFRAKGKLVKKTVVFFLGRTSQTTITISHEHEAGEFLPFDRALSRLKYPNSKELIRAAETFLSGNS